MASQELRIRRLLAECADEGLRGCPDLWPRIQARANARRTSRRRIVAYSAAALAGAALLALALIVGRPTPPAPGEAVVPLLATEDGTARPLVSPADETPAPGVLLAELLSPEELRERLPFALRTPGWLPEGLELAGGTVEGSGDAAQAVLEYRPAGVEGGPAPLRQWVAAGALPSPPLPAPGQGAAALVNGRPATYVEGSPAWLVWQEDELSYALEARGLGQDELVRIAESLR